MRNWRRLLGRATAMAIAVPLCAGSALAGKVMVDYDRQFDFARCSTFAWGEGGTPDASELNQRRIEDAVAAELEAQGLTASDEGDLLVRTHVVVERETKAGASFGIGIGKSTSWGGVSVGGSRPTEPRVVEHDTLVIELLDAATGNLVWEARARGTLSGASAGEMEKQIRKAVRKAFQQYPD
jgi:hypothetical protein